MKKKKQGIRRRGGRSEGKGNRHMGTCVGESGEKGSGGSAKSLRNLKRKKKTKGKEEDAKRN